MLDLVEAAVLKDHVGASFRAMVVQVNEKDPTVGEVMVSDPAVEARVRSAAGTVLPLGSEVTVRLVEADPATRSVLFELVNP